MAIDLKIPIFDAQIDYWHETLPVRKGRAFADTRSAREEETPPERVCRSQ